MYFYVIFNPVTYKNENFWSFVNDHKNDDVSKLRLAYHTASDFDFDVMDAILQIDARQRYAKKLADTLERFPRFYFPDLLAGEQCTSDRLASYHESFIPDGVSLVDMTSGLGIDLFHLSHKTRQSTGVEHKPLLAEALSWNAEGLGLKNIDVIEGDSLELLDTLPTADVVFIDPARRAADGSRVFGLTDCEPDVAALLPRLREKYNTLVIKASPMLDVTRTISDLPGTTDIYLLGTSTECKELDVIVNLNSAEVAPDSVRIHAVTLLADGDESVFDFTRSEESSAETPATGTPKAGQYLLEPYPAVMKAAPVKLLAKRYDVKKLANNTHLYISDEQVDFPGETFKIIDVIEWQSKYIKRFKSRYPKISVTTRNFGMSAEALRAKLGVKDGGNERLFAVTTANDRRLMIVAQRVDM